MQPSSRNSLDAFFKPRGIAIIGASDGDERAGARALANLPLFNYTGGIYPVTPSFQSLRGYTCYRSILDVPDPVDLAVLCVSAQRTAAALAECARRGVGAAVLFANGFGGDSEEGQKLLKELAATQRESGVRVLGPNTLGFRVVHGARDGIFATNAHDFEDEVTPGPIAIISQSGGLGAYFGSAYMIQHGIGPRYLIDTGNEMDVDSSEALDYVTRDPKVNCIGLILEGSRDGRHLMELIQAAVAAGKPVVVLKVGQTAAAASQMASHTGSLAGSADLFEAALASAGAFTARDEIEFVDSLAILGHGKAPKGRRLGVVSMSGGFAILTIDGATRSKLELPQPAVPPTPEQEPQLRSGTLANPYDYQSIGAPGPQTIKRSLEWMLGQPNIDAVIAWHAYGLRAIPARRKQLEADFMDIMPRFKTPLFGCGLTTPEFAARSRELGVMWFEEPTRLIKALSVIAPHAGQTPPVPAPTHAAAHVNVVVGERARKLLNEIEHVRAIPVDNAQVVQALAHDWGRIILKVENERFPHKTELGLVAGPLTSEEVPAAFARMMQARKAVGAEDTPISAQPCERGVELALGAYVDPVFGPAVMVATGGIFLEILKDTAFATAPINEADARALILKLRGAALLRGARGAPPADIDAAAKAVAALSRFIAKAHATYDSIDINPLIVREHGKGAVAVDALLVPRKK